MNRFCTFRAIVSYGYFLLFFLPFCSPSCHSSLSSPILPGNSTWKLCVTKTNEEILQFKIKSLFQENDKSSGWLTVGFPPASQNPIPFFHINTGSFLVQQTEAVEKEVNCSISGKPRPKMVPVECNFGKAMDKYVNSQRKIKIFWNTGNNSVDINKEGENLINHHSTLNFYLRQDKKQPPENAGSTAMRLLRNYGKSMGTILGISFLLTALIALTICCCCKKKVPLAFSKQKLTKDSSVSFYRDESEGDGQSDESDNDEKVAFIRNNNERNSSV